MEGMFSFVGIIIIVFGVLQVILFFKLWIMTNDVHKITQKLQCSKDKTWNVRRALLYGDKELAKKELIDCLINDFEMFGANGLGFNSVSDIIAKYEPAFQQLGMEIPENLKEFKSHTEIKDIIKFGTN